jgi:K+-transporting ATPase KdpF subunit
VQQSPAGALRRGRVNNTMTIVAAVVAVLLLGYLVVALVRPEKF